MNISNKLRYGFAIFLSITFVFFITFIVSIFNCGISKDTDFLSWIYYITSSLGHASLFSLALYLILYIPISIIFRNNKIATILYAFGAILVQLVLIIDGLVFDLYKFHINGFVLELIFGGAANEVFVFDWTIYYKFGGLIILFVLIPISISLFISSRYYVYLKRTNILLISLSIITCILISHLGYTIARATGQSGIQKSATALPLFFPLSANTFLSKIGIIDTAEIDSLSFNKPSSDISYPIHPIDYEDSIPKYNIIYIIIDSWNPRTFDPNITPYIYDFSQKAQFFSEHNSSHYGTRGGIFGLFFGLSFTYENEFSMAKMSPLLIDRLIDAGYEIETFPSANFTSPPLHEIVFRRVPGIITKSDGNTPLERDNYITDKFIDYIDYKDSGTPFFSFIFYDLAHAMTMPKEYQKKFSPAWEYPDYLSLHNEMDPTPFFNLYKNCIHYDDQLVGKVLKAIEKKGLLDNSIIIITGDHGQEFNENKKNYWGHGGNYSKWQIQVPFIIYYPGIEAGKTYNHMTTHYDLSPTILNRFLGVKNNTEDYSMGYDLWDRRSRYPHIVGDHIRYGFITEDLILKTDHIGKLEVTDKELNEVSKDLIDIKDLQKSIEKKNKFYKK